MKRVLFFCLILFIASCCRPKSGDCDFLPPSPRLNFYVTNDSLTGFTNQQLNNLQIIRTAKNNFIPIDSFYYFFPNDTSFLNTINKRTIQLSNDIIYGQLGTSVEIKNYNFLIAIRKANFIDTISGINYSYLTNKVHCSSCGDGYGNETIITNYQYYSNGMLVSYMNDTTLIHR